MHGIEQLGYEVVEEPMVPIGGVQAYKNAADMLADFGRNGDTYIVHAAEGETMVPMEVLEANPRLKEMLFNQMEEMGVEPERYIVGNELNSINPVTGQPEFFFKKIFKAVKKVVKKVVNVVKKVAPIVLPIVAPFLLPAMPVAFATGLGSLAGGLIQGQSFKDALKGAVITGGLAGLGNWALGGSEGFGSGSFFGSKLAGSAGLGDMNLKDAFTFDNPFTSAMAPNLEAIKAANAVPPPTGVKPPAVDPATGNVKVAQGEAGFFNKLGQAANPFDNSEYGFGDLYSEYLSPSRASIQPDITKVTAEGAKAGAEAVKATNEALATAGQPALTAEASQAIVNNSIKSATAAAAPGFMTKYAPLAATALGGAAASDAIFGTNIITPGEEESLGYDPAKDPITYAQDLIDANPEKYTTDPATFFAGNPQYADRFATTQSQQGGAQAAAQGFTNPYLAALQQAQANPAPVQTAMAMADPNTGMYGLNTQGARSIFAAQGGEIVGPGTPTSDSIPAMLSDGEFVMNARAVRGAGGGDRQAGAKRMYDMMRQFERRA